MDAETIRRLGNTAACAIFLLPCVIWDIRTQKIPRWYLRIWLAAGCVGEAIFLIMGRLWWQQCLLSLVPGAFLILLAILTREKIGLGDGICFLIIGLMEGAFACAMIMILSFLFSSVYGGYLFLCKRAGRNKRLPFLPFITGAVAAEMVFRLI